jgi:hypothetical protein
MQSVVLFLLFICLSALVTGFHFWNEVGKVQARLEEKNRELDRKTDEVKKIDTELSRKTDAVGKLKAVVTKQGQRLSDTENLLVNQNERAFNRQLAIDIVDYMAKESPRTPVYQLNPDDILKYIQASKKYSRYYAKKFPHYSAVCDWRVCMAVVWLESGFQKNPPVSPASDIGGIQACEYTDFKKPTQKLFLYPTLCALGYKQATYEKTIQYFKANIDVQVHCFYSILMGKMRLVGGDPVKGVVAYNHIRMFPTVSGYWGRYQDHMSVLNTLIARAHREVGSK